jgi:hypothetical protein
MTRFRRLTSRAVGKLKGTDSPITALTGIIAVVTAVFGGIAWTVRQAVTPEPADDRPACLVASADYERSGYVLADRPSAARYTPDDEVQCNSAGADNVVEHRRTGFYVVGFPKLGVNGGIAEVTPVGSQDRICTLAGWGVRDDRDEAVQVACFDRRGAPADSAFSARFLYKRGVSGATAYVRSTEPTAASYVVEDSYAYNSQGGETSIDRRRPGVYVVYFRRQQRTLDYANGGTVKVSAVGGKAAVCTIESWYKFSDDYLGVAVRCAGVTGAPMDSRFAVTFSALLGRTPQIRVPGAYIWANKPAAANYSPHDSYQYSSKGTMGTVFRAGRGDYVVDLPGLTRDGGNAQVSAYGSAASCMVAAVVSRTESKRIRVACRAPSGQPADAMFTLTYWQ